MKIILLSYPRKGLLPNRRLLRHPDKSGFLAMTKIAFCVIARPPKAAVAISIPQSGLWQQAGKRESIPLGQCFTYKVQMHP